MNKRECKARLKDIVELVDKRIFTIERYDKKLMKETEEKIEDLSWHFEINSIMPNSFDTEKMMKEILVDYFYYDEEIVNIRRNMMCLTDNIYDHIEEMSEGVTKKEWERFYNKIVLVEVSLRFKELEIKSIEEFIEYMKELKTKLQDLI